MSIVTKWRYKKREKTQTQCAESSSGLIASLKMKFLGRLIVSDLRRLPAHDLISLHHEIQRQ